MLINGLDTLAVWTTLITLLAQWRLSRTQELLDAPDTTYRWLQLLGVTCIVNLLIWALIFDGTTATRATWLWRASVVCIGLVEVISMEVVAGMINFRIPPLIRAIKWGANLTAAPLVAYFGTETTVTRHFTLFEAHYVVPTVRLWVLSLSALAIPTLLILAIVILRAFPTISRARSMSLGALAMAGGFLADHAVAHGLIDTPYLTSAGAWIWTMCLLWIGEDLAQKQLRERFDARHVEAAQAAVRSSFLANMSHELRTPLTGIIGLTDLLQNDPESSQEQHRLANDLQRSSLLLNHMIGEVLELEGAFHGRASTNLETFRSSELMDDLRRKAGAMLPGSERVTFVDSSSESSDRNLSGDRVQLVNTMVNIILHALDRDAKQVTVRCLTQEARRGFCALRIVVNTGPDGAAEPFDPDEPSLALTRQLAGFIGARLNAHLIPNTGWVAQLELSLPEAEEQGPRPDEAAPVGEIRLDGLHLLVVDDHSVNRMMMAVPLRQAGATIVTVEGGQKALTALQNERFDMMLLDLHMPGMSGFETVVALRELERSGKVKHQGTIPVLPVSADTTRSTRDRCIELGMESFLAKPHSRTELRAAVADHLDIEPVQPQSEPPKQPEAEIHPGLQGLLDMVGGDPTLAAGIVEEFIDRSPELMMALDEALEANQIEDLRRHAHTLKGSLLTLGFDLAGEAAAELERTAKAGNTQAFSALLGRLHTEVGAAELTMRSFLERVAYV